MKKKLFLYVPLLFLVLGCANLDHFPEPAKGDILGYVEFRDIGDNALFTDPAGVRVVLEGANPQRETTTDNNGKWLFHDVPAGTYELTFKKEGFADFKLFSVEHVGGQKPTVPFDGQMGFMVNTDSKVSSLKSIPGKDNVAIQAIFESGEWGRVFLGKVGVNSPTSYVATNTISASSNPEYPYSFLLDLGFKSGDQISFKGYGSVPAHYNYFDPHLGLTVYPNISAEFKEVIFKMP